MRRAVAIDLGASSARYALGVLESDDLSHPSHSIRYDVIEQVTHTPKRWSDHDVWDIEFLIAFCKKALSFAKEHRAESIGIDTWGVDHGFIDGAGDLLCPPVCYRDVTHQIVFERAKEHRPWLYAQTGIQHQPFNTIYQLMARRNEAPMLFEPGVQWLLLPDLLLFLLGGERGYERSIASTTQLTGLDGNWNPSVFEKFGLPVPAMPIVGPGVAGEADGVKLMRVGGHDTASAVEGMALTAADEGTIFANLGTWALVGTVCPRADASPEAENQNFTNERTPWNEVRKLTNIPGFYIINGLHADLGLPTSVGAWLALAETNIRTRIDTFDPELYAPESMLQAVAKQIGHANFSNEQWAGIALMSLVDAITDRAKALGGKRILVGGGGAKSEILLQKLREVSGMEVQVAAEEATVLGNLRTQFRLNSV